MGIGRDTVQFCRQAPSWCFICSMASGQYNAQRFLAQAWPADDPKRHDSPDTIVISSEVSAHQDRKATAKSTPVLTAQTSQQ
jgi:hypothetical protein